MSKFYYYIINTTNIGQYNEIPLISKRVFRETKKKGQRDGKNFRKTGVTKLKGFQIDAKGFARQESIRGEGTFINLLTWRFKLLITRRI